MFINRIIENKIKEIKNIYKKKNIRTMKFLSYKKKNIKFCFIFKYPIIIFENKIFSPLKGSLTNRQKRRSIEFFKNKYISIISCLNNIKFFNTNLFDYLYYKKYLNKKYLMKDFIIDKIQLYESFLNNFNYILLIFNILNFKKINKFIKFINFFKIKTIIEIHDLKEVYKIKNIKKKFLIGLNNRNILNFKEDFKKIYFFKILFKSKRLVSESSIRNINYIFKFYNLGINYFLVGENNKKFSFFKYERFKKKIYKKKKKTI
ncbi:hypothetical protein ACWNYI_00215 [Candidatus Vidania fulgoroideorum]